MPGPVNESLCLSLTHTHMHHACTNARTHTRRCACQSTVPSAKRYPRPILPVSNRFFARNNCFDDQETLAVNPMPPNPARSTGGSTPRCKRCHPHAAQSIPPPSLHHKQQISPPGPGKCESPGFPRAVQGFGFAVKSFANLPGCLKEKLMFSGLEWYPQLKITAAFWVGEYLQADTECRGGRQSQSQCKPVRHSPTVVKTAVYEQLKKPNSAARSRCLRCIA